jgi:hypothetical protein
VLLVCSLHITLLIISSKPRDFSKVPVKSLPPTAGVATKVMTAEAREQNARK